jgi:hypothetical protein
MYYYHETPLSPLLNAYLFSYNKSLLRGDVTYKIILKKIQIPCLLIINEEIRRLLQIKKLSKKKIYSEELKILNKKKKE